MSALRIEIMEGAINATHAAREYEEDHPEEVVVSGRLVRVGAVVRGVELTVTDRPHPIPPTIPVFG